MADIFVSYTSSDREWAFWIGQALKQLGHTPRIHEWEINSGDDIYAWMEKHHDAADHVLCVVSDEYLKAPYSTLERNAALWQAAAKRPGFVLFVAVEPCRLPTLSDHVLRCELFGVPEDAAHVRFREFLKKRDAPATATFPGKVFAVSNIPVRVPEHFLGRNDSLAAIQTALRRYEGRVAITALHGLRGVGKTTLAAAYAERHRGDYRATWWIRAQTEPTMRADLVALGVRLGWIVADEEEEFALATAMTRLRDEGEGVLLVYDNAISADELRPYLPHGGGAHLVVTSNAHAWRGLAAPIEIRLWPKEIGAEYLVARTGRSEENAAALDLSETLGGLPLAHEQAAAYCERLGVSLAEYLRRFEAAPARLLDARKDAPADYHDRMTVAKTFGLAIDEAAKLHPAAEPLIVHAALLAPEPIPLYLFAEGRQRFGEPIASALADDGLDEAIATLRAFALVDRETILDERDPTITTESIRLHRLVRQVASSRREGDAREDALRTLVHIMSAVYPRTVFSDPRSWPRTRRLDAVALELVTSPLPRGVEQEVVELLSGLAFHRYGVLAAYAQARLLFERALQMCERVFGVSHRGTAICLSNLARLLQTQNDYAQARRLYERALAIREKVMGPEHPDTASSLNDLGRLLRHQRDLTSAQHFVERALAIRQKVLGPNHPETASSLNNFGRLLQTNGKTEGAASCFRDALRINEQELGPEHHQTLGTMGNLASLLKDQGDLSGARALNERILSFRETAYGPDHPLTATSLSELASLLQREGKLSEARMLLERSLAIFESKQGASHRNTAATINKLARVLQSEGDLAGARPLYERALAINEEKFGPDNQITNIVRLNLARLLLQTNDPDGAMILGEVALAAHHRNQGRRNHWTKKSAQVVADALDALGRTGEAIALRTKFGTEPGKRKGRHPLTPP